jgi:C1A family cysteine protease
MRTYGHIKDAIDFRDLKHPNKPLFTKLPAAIDLRSKCSPVVDQGQLGSCTANAIASGLREYLELSATGKSESLSRLFLYYYERVLEGTVNYDAGAQIRDGMKVLQKQGVCPESEAPYNIVEFKKTPSVTAQVDAAKHRISEYHRVTCLSALKTALAQGKPVVVGFYVFESFEGDVAARTGVIPMPKRGERRLGGHAVLAVGYSDPHGWVIIRNSWGTGWGDQGYCYMPYPVFRKLVNDMWTGQ